MDRISNLSDDLLLHILSSLSTKDVVATTLLSKRWKFLWRMIPKLDFDNDPYFHHKKDYVRYGKGFLQFVDRIMALHNSRVLETLKFEVGTCCNSEDVAHWLRIAIVRHVRELEISYNRAFDADKVHQLISLPESLYTYANLEVVNLSNKILLDSSNDVYLPSLKTLHLVCVEYRTRECHRKLLLGCPVLKELVVDCSPNVCFYVETPSIERLSILGDDEYDFNDKFVINTPSLKYFNIVDTYSPKLLKLSENMSELVGAKINVGHNSPEKLMGSCTSVKRLSLCLSSSVFQQHIRFYQLVHLELCEDGVLEREDLCTFTLLLESCPKLQILKLYFCGGSCLRCPEEPIGGNWSLWRQPCSVPECLRLHLNTFEWMYYGGTPKDKKLVAYILANARHLKTATLGARPLTSVEETRRHDELVSLPTASDSCQILMR